MPNLDEIVNPVVEQEDEDSEAVDNFANGEKGLREIRDYVVNKGKEDTSEADSNGEDDEPPFEMDRAKVLEVAQYLQTVCQNRGDLDTVFDLSRTLLRFRGEIRREVEASEKQASIDSFFTRK
ncbi:hypothetical protein PM082_002297 [Marasmius tenuissimus]|nr:hypothetical protein PM082_002297 [Marasmius tenuissimus]